MRPTVEDLQTFVDGLEAEQGELFLAAAEGLVDAYCRGRHRRGDDYRPGVGEVVLTVAARIAANPEQIQWREQAGSYSMLRGVGFQGFTLTEQLVLNRYRKRAI